jgi:tRNA C32,U32 (ribose-2'-O)-methylase TrmJ
MVKFQLTNEQMRNLMSFLNRTQLAGQEVPAFMDIINALNKPVVEEKEEDKKNN